MKREAKFTVLFRHWLRYSHIEVAAFELKQTTTDSIAFDAVKQHQVDALLAVRNDRFIYKIADDSRGVKPYDMFIISGPAYVVIRYPDFFCVIDINVFVEEKKRSMRKSLTSARAREIAEYTVVM